MEKVVIDTKFHNAIVKFINKVASIEMSNRAVHWMTDKETVHRLSDDFGWSLRSTIDRITEQYIALVGRENMPEGWFQPEPLKTDTCFECNVNRLKKLIVKFKELVPECPSYDGIRSELDNFISETLTKIYLSDLK